jgi:transcriptional regulator
MYIPKSNIIADRNEAIDFMKRFSFGTVITSKDNIPTATHLPFLVELKNDKIYLTSHFAKANEQWKHITGSIILVIFSEPHAYVSPSNYEKELNVPTWNYISIHSYGTGKLVTEFEKVMEILEKTIDNYEKSYQEQWKSLPDEYKINMIKGIIAFEIEVVELQGRKKLSQNKSAIEQRNIINTLSKSGNSNESIIAEYMMKELKSEVS